MAAGVLLTHREAVRRHPSDRSSRLPLSGVIQIALHCSSLAMQLNWSWENTLHAQSSVNATHHDLGHLIDKFPDILLALARDGHFVGQ